MTMTDAKNEPERDWSTDNSLLDVLLRRVHSGEDKPVLTFLDLQGSEVHNANIRSFARDAAGTARMLKEQGVQAGDRVLLVFPPDGIEFVWGFVGCMILGAVAVPVPSPDPRDLDRDLAKLAHVADNCGAKFALTHAKYRAIFSVALASQKAAQFVRLRRGPKLPKLKWLTTDKRQKIDDSAAIRDLEQSCANTTPTDLVFLQYTSGSTSQPKGVRISQHNLLHNLWLIERNISFKKDSVMVGWVPLFHDMGLTGGILSALYTGAHCVFFSPMSFLRRPRLWLDALHKYQGTHAAGPNFGYEYVLRGLKEGEGWNLSPLRGAIQGGEPMKVPTVERFCEKMNPHSFQKKAFTNVFGMAETVLFVCGSTETAPTILELDRDSLEREKKVVPRADGGTKLISVGRPDPDVNLCAVDPISQKKLADGEVGELWLSSASVSSGYWGRPEEENAATFRARLADDENNDTYLRSGDLGFTYEGEVYICGRIKDMIIIGGRNIYPQDIEESVLVSDKRIRPGCMLAFGTTIENQEKLVVVVEVRKDFDTKDKAALSEIASNVGAAVSEEHSLSCHEILMLPAGKIPKTTSGKLQRSKCAKMWQDQEFEKSRLAY